MLLLWRLHTIHLPFPTFPHHPSICPSIHQPDDAAAVAAALVDSGGLRVTRRIIAEVSLKRPQGQIDPSPPEEEEEEEVEVGGGET